MIFLFCLNGRIFIPEPENDFEALFRRIDRSTELMLNNS